MDFDEFSSKKINVAFLFYTGRSGSTLFHSLIDNHEQVLTLPFAFPFFHDWLNIINNFSKKNPSSLEIKELINSFFSHTNIKISCDTSSFKKLGINRDEKLDLDFNLLSNILYKIIENIEEINGKVFFMALHLAYAKLKNINLENIKCIFFHHHYRINNKYLINYSFKENINEYIFFLDELKNYFPNLLIITTIRNPYNNYYSIREFIKRKNIFSPEDFLTNIKDLIICLSLIQYEVDILGDKFKLVKFEELHNNLYKNMKEVSDFLEINFTNTLLESTFSGKLYWGDNPKKIINGTDKKMNKNTFLEKLPKDEKLFIDKLFRHFSIKYNYELFESEIEILDNQLTELELLSYFYFLLNGLISSNNILDNYAYYRSLLFKISNPINKEADIKNNIFSYNNISFFIKNTLDFSEKKIPNNGYFICYLVENKLDSKKIDLINNLVDQLWVPNKKIKENCILLGIDIEIINIVPPIPNITLNQIQENKKIILNKKKSNNFNFLFISTFNNINDINYVIDTFYNNFNDNNDIFLNIALIDEETANLNLDYLYKTIIEKKYSSNNIKNRITFFKSKLMSEKNEIFIESNCIIFTQISLLNISYIFESLSYDCLVIVTESDLIVDFLPENSIKNIKFSKNNLNEKMKEVFEQKEFLSNEKTTNEIESFLLDNSFNKIKLNINNLINKAIKRLKKAKTIKELENKANLFFNNGKKLEAEKIFSELIKYNRKEEYLYYLALINYQLGNFNLSLEYASEYITLNDNNNEILDIILKCL